MATHAPDVKVYGPLTTPTRVSGFYMLRANEGADPPVAYVLSRERAQKYAAVDDLLAAAQTAVLHFRRSHASGSFQGDDEHEAWTELEKAIAKAEGRAG